MIPHPEADAPAAPGSASYDAAEAHAVPLAAISRVPPPVNDTNRTYLPGSAERAELKARLAAMSRETIEIPIVIGGREIRTGRTEQTVMPHDHRHVLAKWHVAGAEHAAQAVAAAADARREWASWSWQDRAAVFLRAAELLSTTWRATVNASTMLGQSKTVFQAEIDAASELVDFWRFNPHYAQELLAEQPLGHHAMWNQVEYRPLEGFVYAVSPFNFTSIAGNLPTAPALMGNTVVWKPASSAMLSAYYILRLLEAAGLPPGVINFVPGDAAQISSALLQSPDLAGVHFTGSTAVFQGMWKTVGEQIGRYRSYPRMVGETGGKDFIVAHASADVQELAVAIVRGGFEYQGQKCSAASRVYVPRSLWPELKERVVSMMREITVGDVSDFRHFMGAVIDRKSFTKITGYQDFARQKATIVQGGGASDHVGYFVDPTLVEASDPASRLLCEEIFGPVVTVHVYADERWAETLSLIDRTSPYALTGAVFSRSRTAVRQALGALRNAAGNFYINDKPTGAVVGQQPFGGARGSGTNDKAGSKLNLVRWVSARTIKETFAPPREWKYSYMSEE
jgi:1-pyrroline-5-carboxylate dehydrogenase